MAVHEEAVLPPKKRRRRSSSISSFGFLPELPCRPLPSQHVYQRKKALEDIIEQSGYIYSKLAAPPRTLSSSSNALTLLFAAFEGI